MIKLPPIDLLKEQTKDSITNDVSDIKNAILSTTNEKGFEISIVDIKEGPSYTRFYAKPVKKTKYKDIKGIEEDIALGVKSPSGSVYVTPPIQNTDTFGIDVPNKQRTLISLRNVLENGSFEKKPLSLEIPLGITNDGKIKIIDLERQPHILIGGAVCGGKSSFLNTTINTLLLRTYPEDVKMILVDTKRVEFHYYQELPNLLCPVIYTPDQTVKAFVWLKEEMERRYSLFEKEKTKNIEQYNEKMKASVLPYIIFAVDELSDAMCYDPINVEKSIITLAKLSRATGIHMILCVQRPSTDIITGLIKSVTPARVCFQTMSKLDSRVVLDFTGAEVLLGRGDLLYLPPDSQSLIRAQAPFIFESEIETVTKFIKDQAAPDYDEGLLKSIGL